MLNRKWLFNVTFDAVERVWRVSVSETRPDVEMRPNSKFIIIREWKRFAQLVLNSGESEIGSDEKEEIGKTINWRSCERIGREKLMVKAIERLANCPRIEKPETIADSIIDKSQLR